VAGSLSKFDVSRHRITQHRHRKTEIIGPTGVADRTSLYIRPRKLQRLWTYRCLAKQISLPLVRGHAESSIDAVKRFALNLRYASTNKNNNA